MIKALYTAATGMKVQQTNVDVVSNNLANVNTAGFKRSQADFQDLIYLVLQAPGSETGSGLQSPTGIEIGSGARLASTTKVFTQGVLEPTGRPLDVAIQGDGFYQVQMPDGSSGFTRDGAFRVDSQGNLVTTQGYLLDPPVSIPPNSRNVAFAEDGTISFQDSSNNLSTSGPVQLVRFANPAGLQSAGGNIFLESAASGTPEIGNPSENGFGSLLPANLERSNVEVVNELVNLIVAQRAYEVNSKAIRVGDEMLSTSTNLMR